MTVTLNWLKENDLFSKSMKKMTLNNTLNEDELEFMLTCAILKNIAEIKESHLTFKLLII